MYEVYVPRASSAMDNDPRPLLSLSRKGYISLNGAAQDAISLTSDEDVVLLFDRVLGRIALRPARGDDASASRIKLKRTHSRARDRRPTRTVALGVGSGFLTLFGIRAEKAAGRLELHRDAVNRIWYAQLPTGAWVVPEPKRELPPAVKGRFDAVKTRASEARP